MKSWRVGQFCWTYDNIASVKFFVFIGSKETDHVCTNANDMLNTM